MRKVAKLFILTLCIALFAACSDSTLLPTNTAGPTLETPKFRQQPVDVFNKHIATAQLSPQAVTGPNLLSNGGFESGTQSWGGCSVNAISSSTDAYEGTKALKVSLNDCFYQSATVTPGEKYNLSCYVKVNSGTAWTGMGMSFSNSSWVKLSDAPSAVISGAGYQRYDVVGTAPTNAKYASMWFYSDNDVVVDSCILSLDELPVLPPTEGNLLDNGSFEVLDTNNKAINWAKGCGGTWTSNAFGFNGKDLSITGGACVDQSLSAEDISQLRGQDYIYSCFVKNSSGYASMSIFLGGEPVSKTIPTSNSYQEISISGTAGSSISSGFVSIYSEGTIIVDDCRLSSTGGPGTPTTPPLNMPNNLLQNGDFEAVSNSQPVAWNKGCGGTGSSVNDSSTGAKAYALSGGACVDEGFTRSVIAGKSYDFSCYVKNSGGYAAMSIFFSDEPKSIVIPESTSYQKVTITGTAPTNITRSFVSLYAEGNLTIDDCNLTAEDEPITSGQQQWIQSYGTQDTLNGAREYVDSVSFGTNTSIYAVGKVIKDLGSYSSTTDSLSIRKYNRDGSLVFSKTEDFKSTSGYVVDTVADRYGNLYVLESSTQSVSPRGRQLDLWLHKYNFVGTKLFEKNILSVQYDSGNSAAVSFAKDMVIGSNAIYISAKTEGQVKVLKYNLLGFADWVKPIDDSYNIGGLAVSPLGKVYISSATFNNATTKLTKINNDGTQAWERIINNSSLSTYLATDDSNIYVMGGTDNTYTNEIADKFDAYLWKYDNEGNQIWTSQYATNLRDKLTSAVVYDGALYTTGVTFTHGFIKKINLETAAEEWSVNLDVDGYDIFNDIQVDSTGIYAGGHVASQYGNSSNGTLPNIRASDAFITKYSLP